MSRRAGEEAKNRKPKTNVGADCNLPLQIDSDIHRVFGRRRACHGKPLHLLAVPATLHPQLSTHDSRLTSDDSRLPYIGRTHT